MTGQVARAGTVALGAALVGLTAASWAVVVRDASSMDMSHSPAPSLLSGGVAFTVAWGIMMAAMMLPSAAPMILLYQTVRRRLSEQGERAIPAFVFAAVYLVVWMLFGVPVYAVQIAVGRAAEAWPAFESLLPYLVAAVLVAAGLYQFSSVKRVCLGYCEAPLGFLMQRWRSGYGATLRLAVEHAGYCVGCCWGLMVILVAAGAMSLPWVLGISAIVFAEKILPRGWWTARVVGVVFVLLGIAVAAKPELAMVLG